MGSENVGAHVFDNTAPVIAPFPHACLSVFFSLFLLFSTLFFPSICNHPPIDRPSLYLLLLLLHLIEFILFLRFNIFNLPICELTTVAVLYPTCRSIRVSLVSSPVQLFLPS